MSDLLMVKQEMVGVHPIHTEYPLIPGDVLTKADDGTFVKHTGLCVFGFTLSAEQEAALEPVEGQIVHAGNL